jgi:HEAT repeat protein
MSRGGKRWIGIGLLVCVSGAGGLAVRHRRAQRAIGQAATGGPTLRGLAASEDVPTLPSVPETREQIAAEVAGALATWRQAILDRNAETVVALDSAFLASPDRYREALAESARTETDDRVRAFSTRALGKYRNPALAALFEAQLTDKSPYVRQNAAWALGELGAQDDGRAAARRAVAPLRHAHAKDPAADVRTAAGSALARLE